MQSVATCGVERVTSLFQVRFPVPRSAGMSRVSIEGAVALVTGGRRITEQAKAALSGPVDQLALDRLRG